MGSAGRVVVDQVRESYRSSLGVPSSIVQRWREDRAVRVRRSLTGGRYHRRSVMARARVYWRTVRFKCATPPAWLREEKAA